jgi:hypothetical protein
MKKRPQVGAVGEIDDGPILTAGITQVAQKGPKAFTLAE